MAARSQRRRRPLAAVVAAASLVAPLALIATVPGGGVASAAPGALDPNFGSGGAIVSPNAAPASATGVVVLPSGQIAVSGGSSSQFEMSLYSSGGTPAASPWPLTPFAGQAEAVTSATGNVIAAGWTASSTGTCSGQTPVVAVYTVGGAAVAGFPATGLTVCPSGATAGKFNSVAIEPDGDIVAAGTELVGPGATPQTFVAWIPPNGTSGPSVITQTTAVQYHGLSVTAPGNEEAYVAGDSNGVASVAAIKTTGLDTSSFNSGGPVPGLVTFPSAVAASGITTETSGPILVDGTASSGGGFLAELDTTGTLVSSFGSSGTVTTSSPLSAVAYQPLGNIITVAGTSGSGHSAQMMLEQFDGTHGAVNAPFGSGGLLTTSFAGPASAASVATQPDGKVLAAGGAPGGPAGNTSLGVIRAFGPSASVQIQSPVRLTPGNYSVSFAVSLDEPLFAAVSIQFCSPGASVNGTANCGNAPFSAGQQPQNVTVNFQVTGSYPQYLTLYAQSGGGVAPSLTAGSATLQILPPTWSGWFGPQLSPPVGLASGTGPALTSWSPGRLDLFVEGGNASLWHRWSTNGGATWSGWENLGGGLIGGPAAVSWGFNRIDVFVRGTDSQLWHKWWDGTAWSGWEPLGGGLSSSPAVSSWSSGRLDVFVKGTDNAIWHKWWDGHSWSGWESRGGIGLFSPAAVSWAPGRIDLFTIGTDGRMYHQFYSSGWTGWFRDLNQTFASGPGVSTWGTGRLDLFAAASSPGNPMTHMWYDGSWHSESLGGQLTSAPGVVSSGFPRIDTFVQGTDHNLWYQWYGL